MVGRGEGFTVMVVCNSFRNARIHVKAARNALPTCKTKLKIKLALSTP
jgi:hypothetical protein